jgi:hypothetical protein
MDGVPNRPGTTNCGGRLLKRSQTSIARHVDFLATKIPNLSPYVLMELCEKMSPGTVAQCCGLPCRTDDVNEKDRVRETVGTHRSPLKVAPDETVLERYGITRREFSAASALGETQLLAVGRRSHTNEKMRENALLKAERDFHNRIGRIDFDRIQPPINSPLDLHWHGRRRARHLDASSRSGMNND